MPLPATKRGSYTLTVDTGGEEVAMKVSAVEAGKATRVTMSKPAGQANGRALAYLAHDRLGDGFGTAYDISTIFILWFAGASAMAGLLDIVPRYLPRYGMAPDWARSTRPLVLVFTAVVALVTIFFKAGVDNQAGAYATGVLALMTSAAVAVFLTELRRKHTGRAIFFGVIAAIFVYTAVVTIMQRPEGLLIAGIFIAAILAISVASRVSRSTELRVQKGNHLTLERVIFLEVKVSDASDFAAPVTVTGTRVGRHPILRAVGTSVPNALAVVLLHIRNDGEFDEHNPPHIYFEWSERSPAQNALRFLFSGEGDIPPLTHEILRVAEPDPNLRPQVHVGG